MRIRLVLLVSLLAVGIGGMGDTAFTGQEEHITPDYLNIHKARDPKHTAKVDAPKQVSPGEWFDVAISLGAETTHPSLAEHSILWVALYANNVEISRAYFHPVMSKPSVTFTIALTRTTTLRVLAMPNHSAPWQTTHRVRVKRPKK